VISPYSYEMFISTLRFFTRTDCLSNQMFDCLKGDVGVDLLLTCVRSRAETQSRLTPRTPRERRSSLLQMHPALYAICNSFVSQYAENGDLGRIPELHSLFACGQESLNRELNCVRNEERRIDHMIGSGC
jgi:hypothetical protein